MLLTIGHGTRPLPTFLTLLNQYSVDFLVDVRSIPWSAFNPQYRQPALKKALEEKNIRYIYMGDVLGGRPTDRTCYSPEGRVDYGLLQSKPFFRSGLQRLITAYEKKCRVALLCSESNPDKCHRSKLIGRALLEYQIPLQHIDENGLLRTQKIPEAILF